MNQRMKKQLTIVYSNIQGFCGKKDSIQEIMNIVDCDICLLTETMTTNVRMQGMKCITAQKSVGQNVAIILRNQLIGVVPMRLYEPNEVINMLGIRLEIAKNNHQRFYTAHMKQMSSNDKESIANQFDEILLQFELANLSQEGMLLICDANVHVGSGIAGCKDNQDWAGKMLLELIEDEGLCLVNREDICKGIVTRVDPRNGTKSTLDLAICNEFMLSHITEMVIDEAEEYKPARYSGKKVTKTDHNTILVKIEGKKIQSVKGQPYYNTKCEFGQIRFHNELEAKDLSNLFVNGDQLNKDYQKLMKVWDDAIHKSFKKVRSSTKRIKGVDESIKKLMNEERIVKRDWLNGQCKDAKLDQVRSEISEK